MMHVGGYYDACGGYLEYHGGCSVPWGELKKISRFEGFDSQKYCCSFLSITFFPVLNCLVTIPRCNMTPHTKS